MQQEKCIRKSLRTGGEGRGLQPAKATSSHLKSPETHRATSDTSSQTESHNSPRVTRVTRVTRESPEPTVRRAIDLGTPTGPCDSSPGLLYTSSGSNQTVEELSNRTLPVLELIASLGVPRSQVLLLVSGPSSDNRTIYTDIRNVLKRVRRAIAGSADYPT